MTQWFKKYFIPNKKNEHKPYILRKRAILAILVFVLLIEGFFLVQIFVLFPNTSFFSSILPSVLINLTNGERQQNSVLLLKASYLLEKAAQLKADDMAQKGYFAHTSPEGIKPWDWLERVGYSYQAAGENLAVDFLDSEDIDKAWMDSPSHRANILNNAFTEIGIATARGAYNGKETIFVVQFFGKPTQQTVKAAVAPTSQKPVAVIDAKPKPEPQKTVSIEEPAQEMSIIKEIEKESNISGAAIEEASIKEEISNSRASIFKKIFSMPKSVINFVYLALAAMVLTALFLKVFIKIKIQYPKLIFNGIILLFIIISIFYLNYVIVEPGSIF